jgi:hypothetical protein
MFFMQNKRLKLCVFLLFGYGITCLQAQESVNTAGGNTTGTGGTVSYSVGQVFYISNSSKNGMENQGVQQPYEIFEITGNEQTKFIQLTCSVYPNPTTDFLTLEMKQSNFEGIAYHLTDLNGKVILGKNLESNREIIDMKLLRSGSYFLKVTENQNVIKTFKIIKH